MSKRIVTALGIIALGALGYVVSATVAHVWQDHQTLHQIIGLINQANQQQLVQPPPVEAPKE